ncbi:asparagine synthase (glutamine-hydrolyzing) [Candidatus Brachybacter algidus]|uniref:asparagine synthase (glutamine-hydrolyzing) n=1 Tax=Candidatus Brachybacter algidus TaxID=2982024 RepID=UPI001D344E3E|nr:asparagine synthase (glutamine-hydrolyzing) [Candidatus Brachybacter algidus]MBK6450633.1 asparagine synthase (glutamine-hydrolyzing) [Candidatus Brachybacter algidus]
MCGIIGIIDQKATDQIRAATDTIAHRGPDDHGFYNFENLAFGHRRLSILDLSERGHQPMHSPDGRYTIIFNGEIYNHIDLRSELLQDIKFQSGTDTETILHGFIKYGKSIFTRLNGIFTFSIFDNLTKELVLVRDHFGIKPLYYVHSGNSLFFASELKALIKLDFDRTLDIEAFSRYIYYLYNPGEQTPFKNVKKLKPGHFISINIEKPSTIKIEEFYDIPFTGNYSVESESTLISELQSHLKISVERQLLSDVPVGFFLSGGLDSSAIVAMARELHPDKDLNCYTINTGGGFDGFSDDLKYAKICAKHLNVNLEIVDADINIVEDFDKMIWHLDEPQADAAPLNVLSISKRAREKGDIVLLGGTAGDDLFSGYRRHQALNYEAALNAIPGFAWKGLNALSTILPSGNGIIRRFKKIAAQSGKNQLDRMAGYYGWMDHKEVIKLFKKRISGKSYKSKS